MLVNEALRVLAKEFAALYSPIGRPSKDGQNEPPAEGGGRNKEVNFHGEKRSNETHASTA